MDQTIFDELIHFVLQTVSSTDYLRSIGIYRPNPMIWEHFMQQFIQDRTLLQEFNQGQRRTRPRRIIPPGIYPISTGGGGVHYIGVRENNGIIEIGNGYINNFGLPNSIGLDAQPNGSNGLCQTFALMFYFRREGDIQRGQYMYNVRVGLNFLYQMSADATALPTRELNWEPNHLISQIHHLYQWDNAHQRLMLNTIQLARINPRGPVYLSLIISRILLNPQFDRFLINWLNLPPPPPPPPPPSPEIQHGAGGTGMYIDDDWENTV